MARPWLRAYRKMVDSKKVHDLKPELFKTWWLTLMSTDDEGFLPPMDALAFKLRMPRPKASSSISTLTVMGFFDFDGDRLQAHDWDDHNFDSDTDPTARDRKRKSRARSRVTLENGHAKDTRTDTDTDTEQKPIASQLAEPTDLWKQVWNSGRAYLVANGQSEGDARKSLMAWRQNHHETDILRALKTAQQNAVELPIPYINQLLSGKAKPNGSRSAGIGQTLDRLGAQYREARAEEVREG